MFNQQVKQHYMEEKNIMNSTKGNRRILYQEKFKAMKNQSYEVEYKWHLIWPWLH